MLGTSSAHSAIMTGSTVPTAASASHASIYSSNAKIRIERNQKVDGTDQVREFDVSATQNRVDDHQLSDALATPKRAGESKSVHQFMATSARIRIPYVDGQVDSRGDQRKVLKTKHFTSPPAQYSLLRRNEFEPSIEGRAQKTAPQRKSKSQFKYGQEEGAQAAEATAIAERMRILQIQAAKAQKDELKSTLITVDVDKFSIKKMARRVMELLIRTIHNNYIIYAEGKANVHGAEQLIRALSQWINVIKVDTMKENPYANSFLRVDIKRVAEFSQRYREYKEKAARLRVRKEMKKKPGFSQIQKTESDEAEEQIYHDNEFTKVLFKRGKIQY